MERPVVHFELVARDGTSLEGFLSYSEVFGCDSSAVAQLRDELPDDVTFYVSVNRPFRQSSVSMDGCGLFHEDFEQALTA